MHLPAPHRVSQGSSVPLRLSPHSQATSHGPTNSVGWCWFSRLQRGSQHTSVIQPTETGLTWPGDMANLTQYLHRHFVQCEEKRRNLKPDGCKCSGLLLLVAVCSWIRLEWYVITSAPILASRKRLWSCTWLKKCQLGAITHRVVLFCSLFQWVMPMLRCLFGLFLSYPVYFALGKDTGMKSAEGPRCCNTECWSP